jgi:fatty acid desaturase
MADSSMLILSLFDKQYDLSGFHHPGGQQKMIEATRMDDAGTLVRSHHAHNWPKILRRLAPLELDSTAHMAAGDSEDFSSLRDAVRGVFTELGEHRRLSGWRMLLWTLLLASSIAAQWWSMATASTWWTLAAGVLYSTVHTKLIHESSHGSLGLPPAVSRALATVACFPLLSFPVWTARHLRSHHPFTNMMTVAGARKQSDVDVLGLDLLAWSPRWARLVLSWPAFVVSISLSSVAIGPLHTLYSLFSCSFTGWEKLEGLLSLAVLTLYNVIVARLHGGWFHALRWSALLFCSAGAYFGFFSQLTHLPSLISRWRPDWKSAAVGGWLRHQIEHSNNFAAGSGFWDAASFGLNCHIEHHCFPSVTSHQLHKFGPAVQAWCQDRSVVYSSHDNVWAIFGELHTALVGSLVLE